MKKLVSALALMISVHFANAHMIDTVPKLIERIMLENDTVRVTEATLPPGASEPVHSHPYASVIYIMEAGDFIDRDAQGNTIMDTRKLPRKLTFPFVVWKSASGPHSVENLSKTVAMKLLRVEVKK